MSKKIIKKCKNILGKTMKRFFNISQQLNYCIAFGRFLHFKIPVVGRPLSMIVDRLILMVFGADLYSFSINVKHLSVPHPVGVLLGGNGVYLFWTCCDYGGSHTRRWKSK